MSEHRKSKNETAHYTDFDALRQAFHLPKIRKRTRDHSKLGEQQSRFLGTCRACGKQLSYVNDTNVLVCSNEQCPGIKIREDFFVPINRILDGKGSEIAQTLFD